jgi:dynein heavy chain
MEDDSTTGQAAGYDYLISWVVQRLELLGHPESSWAVEANNNARIVDFITGDGPKTLSVVKADAGIALYCDESGDGVKVSGLCAYFIRPNADVVLTKDNIKSEVQYGSIGSRGLSMIAFEHVMKGVVEKQVSKNTELSGQFHRCMATLTDTVHSCDGLTVLYCPAFDYTNVNDVAADKDRLQIMESIVIHWTRQIKDVVNNHDSSSTAQRMEAGPLDEIEFWKARALDLVGIQKQLESTNVQRIIDVLQYAKSNYIGPFQTLTQQIVTRATEANDNLKYLETIRDQCTALRNIEPQNLVTILPDLLNRIRLIWSYSAFYNDNERVSSILRKISNEIIRRFRIHISIAEVLNGDVDFSVARLHEAINCGIEWKAIYYRTLEAIQRNKTKYGRVWEIDDASIFAQIDAFVQRCRDLIEVCESQMQFVRKSGATGGAPGPIPKFGGTRANEIVSAIQGIEMSFETHVDRLRHLDYAVLDVRVSKWHDDYHAFKNAVKDLEVMFTNVINAAFENNSTVAEGVILVETFCRLAKREAIKRCVDRKAADMVTLFLKQVKITNDEMEDRRAKLAEFLQKFLRAQEPQFAGSALWAHSLGELVKGSFESLIRLKHILTKDYFDEAKDSYTQFMNVVHDFKQKRYTQWLEDLTEKAKDGGLQARLDKFLLRRVDTEAGPRGALGTEIVCNFDEDLLALFSEVSYWEKFKGDFSIPYLAHDICNKKEQLRVMREHVMLVVRAYNDIIRDINAEEKRLFMDHMRKLDRHIGQGLTKLTWQSKGTSEMYVKDCVSYCAEVHAVVREFKDCKTTIAKLTKQMGSLLLLRVDKNQIYEEGVFETRQQEHRENMKNQYDQLYQRIMNMLKSIFRNFRDGSTEVQREWRSQITQVRRPVAGGVRCASRWIYLFCCESRQILVYTVLFVYV